MKVLWLTNTTSMYSKNAHTYHGGGWIESLETIISERKDVELGISFFQINGEGKKTKGNVTYYAMPKKKKNAIRRLIENWSLKIENNFEINQLVNVIEDFRPQLIVIFGLEGIFARIQPLTDVPIIIHIQGLINPYDIAYYPPGINGLNFLLNRYFFKENLYGNSILFDKLRFKLKSRRELDYLKSATYLMGRTEWDKSISQFLAPQAKYFHIDEVLRPAFYNSGQWAPKFNETIIIVSTISETIYKGIDIILKTANLLKSHTSLSFQWKIAGLNPDSKLMSFFEKRLNIKYTNVNISLEGKLAPPELIGLLKSADVFVHPSYIDNSPNSICEAQIIGVPVIACNVGGVSSLIKDGDTGILVPANAPYEMTKNITLLAIDKEKAYEIGTKARLVAIKRHQIEKIISELMTVYKMTSLI